MVRYFISDGISYIVTNLSMYSLSAAKSIMVCTIILYKRKLVMAIFLYYFDALVLVEFPNNQ